MNKANLLLGGHEQGCGKIGRIVKQVTRKAEQQVNVTLPEVDNCAQPSAENYKAYCKINESLQKLAKKAKSSPENGLVIPEIEEVFDGTAASRLQVERLSAIQDDVAKNLKKIETSIKEIKKCDDMPSLEPPMMSKFK